MPTQTLIKFATQLNNYYDTFTTFKIVFFFLTHCLRLQNRSIYSRFLQISAIKLICCKNTGSVGVRGSNPLCSTNCKTAVNRKTLIFPRFTAVFFYNIFSHSQLYFQRKTVFFQKIAHEI